MLDTNRNDMNQMGKDWRYSETTLVTFTSLNQWPFPKDVLRERITSTIFGLKLLKTADSGCTASKAMAFTQREHWFHATETWSLKTEINKERAVFIYEQETMRTSILWNRNSEQINKDKNEQKAVFGKQRTSSRQTISIFSEYKQTKCYPNKYVKYCTNY